MTSVVGRSPALKSLVQQLQTVSKAALVAQQSVARENARVTGRNDDFDLSLPVRHTENVARAVQALDAKHLPEIELFLSSQMEYKRLLERYQGSDVDSPERVKASANRVGLNLPDAE